MYTLIGLITRGKFLPFPPLSSPVLTPPLPLPLPFPLLVQCTKDPEPHMTVTSVHPERHIYTGALTGEGGHAITQVVGSTESVPTVATALPPRVILAPAIAPTSHMTQVPPYSVVRLPINSPGSSSSSSREGEMEEEGGGSRGSSEMAGFSGDVSNPFGPYGRNGYTGLVTQDEKEQEEEALKPGPNVR